jgi:hypothetical protein
MKRIHLALALLGFSSFALGALPAAIDPTEVSVPQLPGGFFIGASAFYLQPSTNNGDLDYASARTGVFPNSSSEIQSVDFPYDFNYGINVGYQFADTGNDVNLSYMHIDHSELDSILAAAHTISAINFNISLPDIPAFGNAWMDASYDIHQADLTFGQWINVGCRLRAHPFAGVRYASLDRDADSVYLQPVIGHYDKLIVDESSDFKGFGPLAGMDASYYVWGGLGVVGHLDSGLLVGDIDTSLASNIAAGSPVGRYVFNFDHKSDSTRRIVPVVDAKGGLDYTFMLNNSWDSYLTLEAGYQVSRYFNVVDRLATNVVISPTALVTTQGISGHKTSNVGLNGPYATLTLFL